MGDDAGPTLVHWSHFVHSALFDITDALVSLHWLRVPERITYKVAVLTYRALTGDVPQYLQQYVRVADVPSPRRLRSSASDDLIVPAV